MSAWMIINMDGNHPIGVGKKIPRKELGISLCVVLCVALCFPAYYGGRRSVGVICGLLLCFGNSSGATSAFLFRVPFCFFARCICVWLSFPVLADALHLRSGSALLGVRAALI
ncbi:hypothetical protein K440DRAFT_364565 [Wilcoxina mikolae CBS 423.85]|nr:hypothetical protein K440DRAFT_364565 [Wilcoxina mikolae CBS 423.85]